MAAENELRVLQKVQGLLSSRSLTEALNEAFVGETETTVSGVRCELEIVADNDPGSSDAEAVEQAIIGLRWHLHMEKEVQRLVLL